MRLSWKPLNLREEKAINPRIHRLYHRWLFAFGMCKGIAVCAVVTLLSLPVMGQLHEASSAHSVQLESVRHRFSGKWHLGLGNSMFSELEDSSAITSAHLGLAASYQIVDFFSLSAEGAFIASSGAIQARYDQNQGQSRIQAYSATANFTPPRFLALHAGIIDQGYMDAPLLLDSSYFPGVVEQVYFGSKYQLIFTAQQAVPTSKSLNSDRSEQEPLPAFFSEFVTVKISPQPGFEGKVFLGHFVFHDLPATIAHNSIILGNDVLGEGPNAQFKNGFDGLIAGAGAKLKLTPNLAIRLDGQLIENQQAPKEAGRGQLLKAGVEMRVASVVINPIYEQFFAQSDVAPGYYNSSELGHNNRQGESVGLKVAFEGLGFSIQARHITAVTINSNPYQGELNSTVVKLETDYVEF